MKGIVEEQVKNIEETFVKFIGTVFMYNF